MTKANYKRPSAEWRAVQDAASAAASADGLDHRVIYRLMVMDEPETWAVKVAHRVVCGRTS